MTDIGVSTPVENVSESANTSSGVSRRQMLKRGALTSAVLVWTVPVIEVVGLSPAHAETASAPPPPHGQPPTVNPPTGKMPPSKTPPSHNAPSRSVAPPRSTPSATPTPVSSRSSHVRVAPSPAGSGGSGGSAAGTSGGAAGASTSGGGGIAAAPAQEAGVLAFTGTGLPVKPGIVTGVGLVAAGSIATFAARRRGSAEDSAISESPQP